MYRMLCVLCVMVVNSAAKPMHFLPSPMMPVMPHMPQIQSPLPLLQEQLMELQAMQQVHPMATMPVMNHMQPMQPMQPLIVLLPRPQTSMNIRSNMKHKIKEVNHGDSSKGDEDSVVIDAEPMEPIPTLESSDKAMLMVPNNRLFLNSIISSIPWLPIEINVPDTVVWMYNGIANGISSIIAGLQPSSQTMEDSTQESSQEISSRLKYKPYYAKIRDQNLRPIVLIPLQV